MALIFAHHETIYFTRINFRARAKSSHFSWTNFRAGPAYDLIFEEIRDFLH